MQVQPYLLFNGRCEEALKFYRDALGAEVLMKMLFKESPDPASCPPGMGDKVMHATFKIGDSTLNASDGHCNASETFQGFSLSLVPSSIAEADRVFAALSDGGKVQMPLSKTFFSPRFGMLSDRFGMSWMIYVPGGEPPQKK